MEALIKHDIVFYTLVLVTLLGGIIWAAAITIWPQGPFSVHRRRRPREPDFHAEAFVDLQSLVRYMHRGLHNNGRARNIEILLTFCWRLGEVGRLLTDEAELQIERFCGRAFRQVASDAQTMSSEAQRLRRVLQWLEVLIDAIEAQRVSDCFRALAALFYLADDGWLEYPAPDLPTNPALYQAFHRQVLPAIADSGNLAEFEKRLWEWRRLARQQDAYLFFLLRVLDAFRRPLYLLQYRPDPHLQSRERIVRWIETHLEALEQSNLLEAYETLSYLITEVQLLTEGETKSTYIVNLTQVRRPRAMVRAQPDPISPRGQEPPRMPIQPVSTLART